MDFAGAGRADIGVGRQRRIAFGAQRGFVQRTVSAGQAKRLLLRKQPHQPQRLHVGRQGKSPAGQPVQRITPQSLQLQCSDPGMVKMAQRQGLRGQAGSAAQGPAGPDLVSIAGQQTLVGQHQQAGGKTKLLIQVNGQRAQNVLFGCQL